ncbi:MAG TPA: DUF6058 family natural product biosynthesis protein [Solirubrobacteraceae bacterium]|nr:DUF6058 family natural product biosynthesis protein [Solirubrobacteraceae bacterium]
MTDHLIPPRALADRLAAADEAYIRSAHVTLDAVAGPRLEEVRAAMAAGRLPAPAYVLDDGTEMVARDHLALADAAGADLAAAFRARYLAARGPDPDGAYEGYLSGAYAICLRSATPENIARKDGLVDEIEALLGDPRPRDHDWRDALRAAVDALDDLERPFAPLDEHRFGKRPTRHRLIDDPRERWAWLSA